jgi:hypothetical protein
MIKSMKSRQNLRENAVRKEKYVCIINVTLFDAFVLLTNSNYRI